MLAVKLHSETRMHSSRMCTVHYSGRLSCHTPCHACPCHAHPTWSCMPPHHICPPVMHTPTMHPLHTPPTMHTPCHTCPPTMHTPPPWTEFLTYTCENYLSATTVADGNKSKESFMCRRQSRQMRESTLALKPEADIARCPKEVISCKRNNILHKRKRRS